MTPRFLLFPVSKRNRRAVGCLLKKALCARFAVDNARILCYNAAMELIDISADAQKTKTLSKWLKRDFPLSERTPFRILKKLVRQGKARFYFACEGGEVKAYCVLHFFGGYTQLLYLAVTPEARGSGVGSAVVPLIKAAAGGTLVLEVEDPAKAQDEAALKVRTRRIAFYKRLGFEMLDNVRLLIPGGALRPMSDGRVDGDLPKMWLDMYRELAGVFGVFFKTDAKPIKSN